MPGTAQIFPVVGSGVTFPNPMPTQDVADGTPGAVPPSLAIQIAGTDGTDLRVIKTDTVGNVQTHAALLDSDLISTGTINANGANVAIATNGAGAVVFNVTGTWSGTLQPQYQLADGSWVNGSVFPTLPSGVVVSTITANGQWKTLVGGFKAFRLLSTSWSSGTATISLEASARQTDIQATIKGGTGASIDAAPGSTAPTNAVQVGGVDYLGNARAISTDIQGRQQVVGANAQPPVIVQGQLGSALTNVTIAGTTCVKAYGSPVKVGNTLVVLAAQGVVQAMSISDSVGYHWQTANLGSNAANGIGFIFFARVTTAGTPTITLTVASTDIAMAIYEVEGAGEIDTVGAGTAQGAAATNVLTCPTQQPFGLSFAMFISVANGTISAASPVTPANEVFDTGNIAVAGASVLKNFGGFSANLNPIIQTNVNATTSNISSFKAAIATSVASLGVSCTFRPMATQVRIAGQVEGIAGAGTQATLLPVAVLQPSGAVDAAPSANCETQFNSVGTGGVFPNMGLMSYNGATYDRWRLPAFFRSAACFLANSAVWTPALVNKFRLLRYKIELSANAAITTAGIIPIYLNDGNGIAVNNTSNPTNLNAIGLQHLIFLPSTAGATLQSYWDSDWIDLGNGYVSGAVNQALSLCINGPLASTTVNAGFTQTNGAWQAIQELFKTNQQAAAGPSAALVQQALGTPVAAGSIVKQFTLANTGGNTLIVVASANSGATLTISDTASNSWTSSTAQTTGSAQTMRIFYVVGCKGSANTITVTAGAGTPQLKLAIFEYSGITAADSTSGTTGSSTTPAPGNATAAAVSDFVFSAASNAGSNNTIAVAGAFRTVGQSIDTNGALAIEDNLNQLPAGFAGSFNVVAIGTEGVIP